MSILSYVEREIPALNVTYMTFEEFIHIHSGRIILMFIMMLLWNDLHL